MPEYLQNGNFYVRVPDAVEYLAKHVGGRHQARALIIDAMHSGDLTTTCDKIYTLDEADPTERWEDIIKDAKASFSNIELEPDYWHLSCQWPSETRHWRWNEGNFILDKRETPVEPFYGDALENVHFEMFQLEKLTGKSSRAGVGGRKLDKERWAEFWLNIIYQSGVDKMDWTKFQSRNALKEYMLDQCNEDAFADSSVAYAVDLAWDKLVERSRQDREVWGER